MEFDEFEAILEAARVERSESNYPEEFQLFDHWSATDSDIRRAERELHVRLPGKYKEFMKLHGGGVFLFLDLLPITSPDGRVEDLIEVNKSHFRETDFIAISPVGTGDWWGFSIIDDACREAVDFWDHEDGSVEPSTGDFLDFLTQRGLRVSD